ncbi:ankyrin repeat domain-containing protein, partial [Enterococcus faecalis]
MNKKILMGLLSVVTIPLLAACQGGETPSAASKNSQTVTTQSSAKTESTSTTRSVAQTTSKEEVKEPMKTYEVGAL